MEDEQQLPPPFQLAMMMQQQYQQLLMGMLAQSQGRLEGFGQPEIWLTVKTLIIEVTALRELLLDIIATGPEGLNHGARMQQYTAYCHKLAHIYQAQINRMKETPRILVPN